MEFKLQCHPMEYSHTRISICCRWLISHYSGRSEMELVWSGKSEIFTMWSFTENVGCRLKYSTCLVQCPSPCPISHCRPYWCYTLQRYLSFYKEL